MNVYKGMNCCRITLILKLLTAESLAQSSVETTAKVQVYTCAMSVEVWALRVTMVVTQADDRAATYCLLYMYNARRYSLLSGKPSFPAAIPPPSTTNVSPLTNAPIPELKNRTALAMSLG